MDHNELRLRNGNFLRIDRSTLAGNVRQGAAAGRVTVIECAGIFAGPWTGTLMGDFGAEIVKIEHPEHGDPLRDGLHDEQLQIKTMARNKKSVAIGLHHEEGQALLHDLVEDADVFLENSRPGTLERWI